MPVDEDSELASHDSAPQRALRLDVARALAQLSGEQRVAIGHCYHLDLSHDEAAARVAEQLAREPRALVVPPQEALERLRGRRGAERRFSRYTAVGSAIGLALACGARGGEPHRNGGVRLELREKRRLAAAREWRVVTRRLSRAATDSLSSRGARRRGILDAPWVEILRCAQDDKE